MNMPDTALLEPEVRSMTLNKDAMRMIRSLGILLVPYTRGSNTLKGRTGLCTEPITAYTRVFLCNKDNAMLRT